MTGIVLLLPVLTTVQVTYDRDNSTSAPHNQTWDCTNLEDNAAQVTLVSVQRFCQLQSFILKSEDGEASGEDKVKGDVLSNLT